MYGVCMERHKLGKKVISCSNAHRKDNSVTVATKLASDKFLECQVMPLSNVFNTAAETPFLLQAEVTNTSEVYCPTYIRNITSQPFTIPEHV